MPKKPSSESYIPDHNVMLRAEAEHLHRVLDAIPECEPIDRLFFAHCVTSYKLQSREYPDGVPIPFETIDDYLPGANAFRLQPVLHISPYWHEHCREYRPIDEVMIEHNSISSEMSAEELRTADRIDFNTGRRRNKPSRSRTADPATKHPYPPKVQAVINKLTRNRAYVMLGEFEAHFQNLKAEFGNDSKDSAEGARFSNNNAVREYLYRRPMRYEGGGLYSYEPALQTHKTGRIFPIGAGLLNASRDLKRAAYVNIPGFINYDAKSCQVYIAMKFIEESGGSPMPLIEYLDKDNPKQFYGGALGIEGDDAKQLIIAMCMGGTLPKSLRSVRKIKGVEKSEILNILRKYSADEGELESRLRQAWDVLGPIADSLRKWHLYLLETYIHENKVRGRGGFYLPNAVGMMQELKPLKLEHPRDRWLGVKKVSAHLLQGREQACIQDQILYDEGCHIIGIEHDGFMVNKGEADMSLWNKITTRHGLGGLKLERKDL